MASESPAVPSEDKKKERKSKDTQDKGEKIETQELLAACASSVLHSLFFAILTSLTGH